MGTPICGCICWFPLSWPNVFAYNLFSIPATAFCTRFSIRFAFFPFRNGAKLSSSSSSSSLFKPILSNFSAMICSSFSSIFVSFSLLAMSSMPNFFSVLSTIWFISSCVGSKYGLSSTISGSIRLNFCLIISPIRASSSRRCFSAMASSTPKSRIFWFSLSSVLIGSPKDCLALSLLR